MLNICPKLLSVRLHWSKVPDQGWITHQSLQYTVETHVANIPNHPISQPAGKLTTYMFIAGTTSITNLKSDSQLLLALPVLLIFWRQQIYIWELMWNRPSLVLSQEPTQPYTLYRYKVSCKCNADFIIASHYRAQGLADLNLFHNYISSLHISVHFSVTNLQQTAKNCILDMTFSTFSASPSSHHWSLLLCPRDAYGKYSNA